MHLSIDFETRSLLDVRKVGVYRYVEHPSTRILCFSASYGEHAGLFYTAEFENLPSWLTRALVNPKVEVHAHNAAFERLVMQRIAHKRHTWPWMATERFRCSAARMARLALPRALDKAGKALRVNVVKDKGGTLVMRRLSKPIKWTPEGPVYDDAPEKLERLGAYCEQDVLAEMFLEDATLPMPPSEERYYQLTERINDRGVKVNVDLARRLLWRAAECIEDLNTEMRAVTKGRVKKLTEVQKLKNWIEGETGIKVPTMRKEDMEGFFDTAATFMFPPHVTRAIKIRQEGAKASVSKLVAILQRVSSDGRLRGAFVFHGASTGRYTSQGVQLQNLIRAGHKDWDEAIARLAQFLLEDIAKCMRGLFEADDGHVFVDADYNAIEARGVGWLADCVKLLKIYRTGGDPYCEMGTAIYQFHVTKENEKERFVGKQTILGCGYGMGAPKFEAQCEKFGQAVTTKMAETAVWTYRDEFPEIVDLWYDMQGAAFAAIAKPGRKTEIPNGKIRFVVSDGYLQMILPNGRRLYYKDPKVIQAEKFGKTVPQISFMGEHPITKQWVRETTWGGKLTENAVQAICRDLLFEAMERLEDEDIPVVLSVHDQLVVEVPAEDGEWAARRVKKLMEFVPSWARGFPVKAEPKITERFGK